MARLKDLYKSKIALELTKEFGYKNPMAVPRMEKIIVSMGVGKAVLDKKFLEAAKKDLMMITGQMPVACIRGLSPNSFDGRGNYSMGLAEQSVFPEINPAQMEFQQGMNITFVTTAKTDKEAKQMLSLFGMPFRGLAATKSEK